MYLQHLKSVLQSLPVKWEGTWGWWEGDVACYDWTAITGGADGESSTYDGSARLWPGDGARRHG